jgi:hypothetical protein
MSAGCYIFLGTDGMTYAPPITDVMQATVSITSEWASTIGKAKPETTKIAVMKRPRSTGPELSAENSSEAQCGNNAFGRGASTKMRAIQ